MSRNIKITIEYNGSKFNGWQIQPNNVRTVQYEIQKALTKICQQKVKVTGSGRTDSGVHAHGQVANFKTKSKIPIDIFPSALNANLPKDISIIEAEEVGDSFHSQYSVKSKRYRYTIFNREIRSPHSKDTALHFPQKLNLSRMKEEAKALLGKKDFKSFQAVDPSKKRENTIRKITDVQIKKKGDYIYIEIEADGFLYKMVRNIVGTLLDIGTSKLPKGSMKKIISQKDRSQASPTAKAHGLTLLSVDYH